MNENMMPSPELMNLQRQHWTVRQGFPKAGRQLRDKLIAAAGDNVVRSAGIDDISSVRRALDLAVPTDEPNGGSRIKR
jgi:hypothetical protein